MNYKHYIAALFLTSFFSNQLFADESQKSAFGVGVGVNVSSYFGQQISFPIKAGSLFIEPAVSMYSDISSAKSTNSTSRDYENFDLGLGIFGKNKVFKNTFVYYGSRFGYQKIDYKFEYTSSTNQEESTGFYIAPAFGAEYYFVNNFSIGLEIAFQYALLDVTETDTDKTTNDVIVSVHDKTVYMTISTIKLRYYF